MGGVEAFNRAAIVILCTEDIPESGRNAQRIKISIESYQKLSAYLTNQCSREMGNLHAHSYGFR
jgi:hypothetical protein